MKNYSHTRERAPRRAPKCTYAHPTLGAKVCDMWRAAWVVINTTPRTPRPSEATCYPYPATCHPHNTHWSTAIELNFGTLVAGRIGAARSVPVAFYAAAIKVAVAVRRLLVAHYCQGFLRGPGARDVESEGVSPRSAVQYVSVSGGYEIYEYRVDRSCKEILFANVYVFRNFYSVGEAF